MSKSNKLRDDAEQYARQHPEQVREGDQAVEKDGIGQSREAQQGQPAQLLRALKPRMTPRVVFRALLGVLIFFCGIVFGVWLIIRFRRQIENDNAPNA